MVIRALPGPSPAGGAVTDLQATPGLSTRNKKSTTSTTEQPMKSDEQKTEYGYWDNGVYRHDYRGAIIGYRDKKYRGVSTGSRRPCTHNDCNTDQIYVRCDDGDRSWPCIKALVQIGPNAFQYR